MKLNVRCELVYRFEPPTDAIYKVQVARWPGLTILDERLVVSPDVALSEDAEQLSGARTLRGHLSGEVGLTYTATVDNGRLRDLHDHVDEHGWVELPTEALPYLLPSRYCPSDQFGRFVERRFGGLHGGAKVLAILEFVRGHLSYEAGVSNSETTAVQTFVDGAGVCRDYTHLGISLCRAAGIPARAVSAYSHLLAPPDFHAVFEVWLGDGWWLVDPTGLAPVQGLVRIAGGRDAADIAFLTTMGACELVRQEVTVEAA